MSARLMTLAVAAILAAFSTFAAAQANSQDQADATKSFTHGESKRCEKLIGAEKDLCAKEEATKPQGQPARDASAPGNAQSSAGSSAQAGNPQTFTHGESKRCES